MKDNHYNLLNDLLERKRTHKKLTTWDIKEKLNNIDSDFIKKKLMKSSEIDNKNNTERDKSLNGKMDSYNFLFNQ